MIDDLRISGEWKIQLKMKMKFMSTKSDDESQLMHFNSDKMEITIGIGTDGFMEELFNLLLHNYQRGLEQFSEGSMRVCVRIIIIVT